LFETARKELDPDVELLHDVHERLPPRVAVPVHDLTAARQRFKLSYRDLASIAAELGIAVAPSTIFRWVVRYTGEFVRCWAPFEIFVGRSWRADETYIKVNGGRMYLYRAVDERGRTVASHLSRTRDQTAARTFFRQALKRHGEPRSITLDAFEPSHCALRRMGMRNEFNFRGANPVKIRSCKYLNNIVE